MASIQNQTQNQLIKVLNDFADDHLQLQSFQFGYSFEFAASGDTKFPQLFVEPLPHNHSNKEFFFNFRLIFADLVSKGERNRDEVLSDMLEIAKDAIAQLHHPDYRFILQEGISLQDFFDDHDEEVSGYIATISIKTAFDNDRCQIPTDGISIPVSADHNKVIITDAGNINSPISIGPGGTYTCLLGAVDNSCQTLNDNLTKAERDRIQRIAPIRTGQTISYAPGDDGDREDGRAVDFFTLDCNNSFGNTRRQTDINGLQVYGNDYMIDHLTGLGWFLLPAYIGIKFWTGALTAIAGNTSAGFSDWFMPNFNQALSIMNHELVVEDNVYDYSPIDSFTFNTNNTFWTSTQIGNFGVIRTIQVGNTIITSQFSATLAQLVGVQCRKHF